jgi:hypothetical protein
MEKTLKILSLIALGLFGITCFVAIVTIVQNLSGETEEELMLVGAIGWSFYIGFKLGLILTID